MEEKGICASYALDCLLLPAIGSVPGTSTPRALKKGYHHRGLLKRVFFSLGGSFLAVKDTYDSESVDAFAD